MGRWYCNKKATVEESLDLTIPQLKGLGMLKAGHSAAVVTWTSSQTGKESRIGLEVNLIGEPYARLTYAVTDHEGNATPCDSRVNLVTTPCNLGGVRYWFTCPLCDRRVGGLYCAPGERYFRCRHCNNLTYRSRNRDKIETWGHVSRQIEKLRGEIKRWTWRGLPTRRARRLYKLYRKMDVLTAHAEATLDNLRGRGGA